MRRMRKQPVGAINPWNWKTDPGERYYQWVDRNAGIAIMLDIYESTGRDKSASGVLTDRVVRKGGKDRLAKLVDGVWFWVE